MVVHDEGKEVFGCFVCKCRAETVDLYGPVDASSASWVVCPNHGTRAGIVDARQEAIAYHRFKFGTDQTRDDSRHFPTGRDFAAEPPHFIWYDDLLNCHE